MKDTVRLILMRYCRHLRALWISLFARNDDGVCLPAPCPCHPYLRGIPCDFQKKAKRNECSTAAHGSGLGAGRPRGLGLDLPLLALVYLDEAGRAILQEKSPADSISVVRSLSSAVVA
jgi:hypothetical protein